MGEILNAFATEQLRIDSVTETQDEKQKKLDEKSYGLRTELENKLNGEEKVLLGRMLDSMSEEWCRYAEQKFVRGYRLGVLMTMEVFEGRDDFLGRGDG